MFKLIKIQNSGVNVPEPQNLEKNESLTVKSGDALVIENGVAVPCSPTAAPTHIALASAKSGDTKLVAYAINENMLFETTVNADPTALTVGQKVTLGKDADDSASCVTATVSSGVATIVDLMGATNPGDKITVKF